MKYRIVEIFYSIQGEGYYAGTPAIFIRMAGCSMKCKFCDTKSSWALGKGLTAPQIMKAISSFPCKDVVVTGGEPFEQDQRQLFDALISSTYRVRYETNGSVPIPNYVAFWAWISLSPKKKVLKNSLAVANEVKFLVSRRRDIVKALQMRKQCKQSAHIFLQPISCNRHAIKICVEAVKMLSGLKLSTQLQKYLEIR